MPYDEVMGKFKSGTLRSGGSGRPVTNRKQAIAIMLSEKKKADAGDTEYQPAHERAMRAAMGRRGRG